jgi:hypothetical protein
MEKVRAIALTDSCHGGLENRLKKKELEWARTVRLKIDFLEMCSLQSFIQTSRSTRQKE